jgi:hypothetical protein
MSHPRRTHNPGIHNRRRTHSRLRRTGIRPDFDPETDPGMVADPGTEVALGTGPDCRRNSCFAADRRYRRIVDRHRRIHRRNIAPWPASAAKARMLPPPAKRSFYALFIVRLIVTKFSSANAHVYHILLVYAHGM